LPLLDGPCRGQPFRAQRRCGLPGQDRDPAADAGQGLFERLGLHRGMGVLRPRHATPTLLGHASAGGPADWPTYLFRARLIRPSNSIAASSSSTDLPGWQDGYQRLVANGQVASLTHPTQAHHARDFPAPVVSF
jgi:hypothetical protein